MWESQAPFGMRSRRGGLGVVVVDGAVVSGFSCLYSVLVALRTGLGSDRAGELLLVLLVRR